MDIQLANCHHLYDVAKIHIDAWRATYGNVLSKSFLDAFTIEKTHRYWGEVINRDSSHLYVSLVGRKVNGFLLASSCKEHRDDFEIESLYIKPEMKRNGIGSRLVMHAMNRIEGKMFLWVLSCNHEAIKFYKAVGFVETSHQKRIFMEPEMPLDVIKMVWES